MLILDVYRPTGHLSDRFHGRRLMWSSDSMLSFFTNVSYWSPVLVLAFRRTLCILCFWFFSMCNVLYEILRVCYKPKATQICRQQLLRSYWHCYLGQSRQCNGWVSWLNSIKFYPAGALCACKTGWLSYRQWRSWLGHQLDARIVIACSYSRGAACTLDLWDDARPFDINAWDYRTWTSHVELSANSCWRMPYTAVVERIYQCDVPCGISCIRISAYLAGERVCEQKLWMETIIGVVLWILYILYTSVILCANMTLRCLMSTPCSWKFCLLLLNSRFDVVHLCRSDFTRQGPTVDREVSSDRSVVQCAVHTRTKGVVSQQISRI